MIELVFAAVAVSLVVTGAVIYPLLRGKGTETSRAARDAQVYRDQLAELDRDRERGLISDREAAGTRAELARRLIAADTAARRGESFGPAPRAVSAPAIATLLAALPLAAGGIYLAIGAPALPDRPFSGRSLAEQRAAVSSLPGQRMSQAEAEALAREQGTVPTPEIDPADDAQGELIARLARIVEDRPEDTEGRFLLAQSYMRRGRFSEAAELFAEIGEILGPRARVGIFTARAEALVLAAGGYVSEAAEDAIRTAARLDQSDPMVRYYIGLALMQNGRRDEAVDLWQGLLRASPPDAPWRPLVAEMLARAGVAPDAVARSAPPPSERGPGAAEIEAAQQMSAEERQAMIEGMVAGLAERLAAEGGAPEEWVRLIRARLQLGDRPAALAAFEDSQEALDGSAASFVREQALLMGLLER